MGADAQVRDRFSVVVHVLLWRGGGSAEELFLIERAGTGFMDGFYVPPGGHQHAGESVADAARRECAEEAGVMPAELAPLCVLPYRSGRHQGVNFVFEARSWRGEPRAAEPELARSAGWHAADRLPPPPAPWLREALELREQGRWFRELYWP